MIFSSPTSYLVLSLVLALFAVAPLFYPGYLQTHNGLVALWNVIDLRANLGNWLWTPHIGLDFDPFRSDGLLPYYLAAVLPLEPVMAVKVILGLSWLVGNAGMVLWLRRWLGHPGALVAALVYTYLPYHIATVYVRGAWGEVLLWSILPWAIWASQSASQRADESSRKSHLTYAILAALIWLALGLSYLGLALWAFVFVALLLWLIHHCSAIIPILANFMGVILAVMTTLSISASSPHTFSPPFLFADHFLYPFQLFSSSWGFGPSRPGWNDGMSFQVGLPAIGLTMLTLFLWQRRSNNSPIHLIDRHLTFFGSMALVFILLQFDFTEPLWNLPFLPLVETLAYPWQLLGVTGLSLAVLAGASVWLDDQLTRLPLFGAIVILVILSSYPYLSPQFMQIEPEMRSGPQALLGESQLALLTHDFSIEINGNTAGFERGPAIIPLATYGVLKPDEVLRLNVTWQPLQTFSEDWKVFAHLVDANSQVLVQFDGQPLAGNYPTSQWVPGELIEDSYPLAFPTDAPPGPYRVFVGLYNEATGARLPVPGQAEGRVILNVK